MQQRQRQGNNNIHKSDDNSNNNNNQNNILGIHNVTAIASNPQKNIDFYTRILGLRLVKLTVNFDDPTTYHLYFGDEVVESLRYFLHLVLGGIYYYSTCEGRFGENR